MYVLSNLRAYHGPSADAWNPPAIKHIKAAYDMGINTFDTANVYSNGVREIKSAKESH